MLWRTETVHLLVLRDLPKEVEHLAPPFPHVAHRDGAPPEAKRPAPPPTLVTG